MFFIIFLACIPAIVRSHCYSSPSSQTWTCDYFYKSTNNLTYDIVLRKEQQIENLFVTNYRLKVFQIDDYPLTLRFLNASGNQFDRIYFTGKHRETSNIRQISFQSNQLVQFDTNTIILPNSLERISLANNKLTILDGRLFSHLKNLVELDLRNNLLKRIAPDLILNRHVLLNFNPLNCQCTKDDYRSLCESSTTIRQNNIKTDCRAPYYDPRPYDPPLESYLRFSTFTLTCPISGQPTPVIIWSTPFGNLTSVNSTSIDLLSSTNVDESFYITLTALAGPLTARTEHTLHAYNQTYLSVTQARAALQNRISCSGINMLGVYTHEFNFDIDSYVLNRALWHIIYTMSFGFFMALVAGALCVTLKRTYYSADHLKTPPIYPTMAPNSAARTPPNFELNQWLSLAAANISGTLEQVRDKLRLGVQQVSEHMGQTMGRATELFTYGVQHAGDSIRQVAETSAAYLHNIRETGQQRLNTMRVQTMSSLRNPGHLMRAGMNILTTQVNSLRDYCGVTSGHALPINLYDQQLYYDARQSPLPGAYLNPNRITTITEEDESILDSTSLITSLHRTPYAGHTSLTIPANASGIGRLDLASNSVMLALSNFNQPVSENQLEEEEIVVTQGQMSGGIGTFRGNFHDQDEGLIDEPERLIMYGQQRPIN